MRHPISREARTEAIPDLAPETFHQNLLHKLAKNSNLDSYITPIAESLATTLPDAATDASVDVFGRDKVSNRPISSETRRKLHDHTRELLYLFTNPDTPDDTLHNRDLLLFFSDLLTDTSYDVNKLTRVLGNYIYKASEDYIPRLRKIKTLDEHERWQWLWAINGTACNDVALARKIPQQRYSTEYTTYSPLTAQAIGAVATACDGVLEELYDITGSVGMTSETLAASRSSIRRVLHLFTDPNDITDIIQSDDVDALVRNLLPRADSTGYDFSNLPTLLDSYTDTVARVYFPRLAAMRYWCKPNSPDKRLGLSNQLSLGSRRRFWATIGPALSSEQPEHASAA